MFMSCKVQIPKLSSNVCSVIWRLMFSSLYIPSSVLGADTETNKNDPWPTAVGTVS